MLILRILSFAYFFLSVHLCASANVTSGRAISTVTVTADCRALLQAGESRTPVTARTPSGLVAFDDSNMAGRTSEFQIQCKHFFQLFCNCLKVRENNFNSSSLAIHGLGGYLSIFDQNVHKCSLSDTKEAMPLKSLAMHCISVSYESLLRNLLIF